MQCPSPFLLSDSALLRIAPGSTATKVKEATIVQLHRCGDGKASTTDRVVLKLRYAGGSATSTPRVGGEAAPMRLLAKVILLNPLLQPLLDTACVLHERVQGVANL